MKFDMLDKVCSFMWKLLSLYYKYLGLMFSLIVRIMIVAVIFEFSLGHEFTISWGFIAICYSWMLHPIYCIIDNGIRNRKFMRVKT